MARLGLPALGRLGRVMASPSRAADPARASTWIGVMLHAVGVAAGFAGLAEWDHYREVLGWSELGAWDTLVVVWALAAKSLWVLTPALVLASVLAWGRWPRAAWGLAVAAGTIVFGWLAVDLRVHAATRNHASDYLAFLREPNPWEWAGEAAYFLAPLLAIAAVVGLVQAGLAWVFRGVGRALSRRWPWLGRPAGVGLSGLAYLTVLVGVVPAARSANRPLVLQQLGGAMPVSASLVAGGGPPIFLDLDESFRRFNLEAQAVYRRHFERVARPRPADDTARLSAGARPHVVVLVVESLRFDVLDPQSMPRLDAWSRGALRFLRHFAPANISHLGLFALLYGRHPLLYDWTLDAGAPPQLVHTLRRSGYRAAYFGSADLTWRCM
ncbi:MAG: sulfatase-like hydrolase/transferase, partial [Gemmatimonadales bacterium]